MPNGRYFQDIYKRRLFGKSTSASGPGSSLDATSDLLGTYDLILCRDLLVHLTNEQALKVIDNFKESGSTYLLATTFVNLERNVELRVPRFGVGWRPLNLAVFPFNLGSPIRTINENSSEGRGRYQDKSLGLWKLN